MLSSPLLRFACQSGDQPPPAACVLQNVGGCGSRTISHRPSLHNSSMSPGSSVSKDIDFTLGFRRAAIDLIAVRAYKFLPA
jgi:hypothetical protein